MRYQPSARTPIFSAGWFASIHCCASVVVMRSPDAAGSERSLWSVSSQSGFVVATTLLPPRLLSNSDCRYSGNVSVQLLCTTTRFDESPRRSMDSTSYCESAKPAGSIHAYDSARDPTINAEPAIKLEFSLVR